MGVGPRSTFPSPDLQNGARPPNTPGIGLWGAYLRSPRPTAPPKRGCPQSCPSPQRGTPSPWDTHGCPPALACAPVLWGLASPTPPSPRGEDDFAEAVPRFCPPPQGSSWFLVHMAGVEGPVVCCGGMKPGVWSVLGTGVSQCRGVIKGRVYQKQRRSTVREAQEQLFNSCKR